MPTSNTVALQSTSLGVNQVRTYKALASGPIPLTTLYSVPNQTFLPASLAMQIPYLPLFRLTAWVWLTQQSSNGHQIGPLTVFWTDPNGNPQSCTVGFNKATQRCQLAGEGATFAISSNALASPDSLFAGMLPLVVKPGSNINFQMAYSSTQNPNAQYAIALVLEGF